jgi:hypothetical protein
MDDLKKARAWWYNEIEAKLKANPPKLMGLFGVPTMYTVVSRSGKAVIKTPYGEFTRSDLNGED